MDTEKFTKDYFLSALDETSSHDGDGSKSYAVSVQNSFSNAWKGMIGSDHARYFFYQDITRIRWNGNENELAERGYSAQTGMPHIGLGPSRQKTDISPCPAMLSGVQNRTKQL